MDDVATVESNSLYERDFFAWTQEQATLLRQGRVDRADLANIAEEIETLGRTEVAELRSRLKVLTQHLLKEIYQPEKASRSWALTIVNQRQDLARHMRDNPSLKPKVPTVYAEAYADARALTAIETGLKLDTFPTEPPFSYTQAIDPSFWPGRSLSDRS